MHSIPPQNEITRETIAACPRDKRFKPINIQEVHSRATRSLEKGGYVVRIADSDFMRAAALELVHERYSARGYRVSNEAPESPHELTIVVSAGHTIAGTATLRVDSPLGVGADAVFQDQVDIFRDVGAKVCEITRFAVGRGVDSKIVISAAFHFLYIVGYFLRRCTHVFIEVNPRHVRFYEMVYGFECRSNVRLNPRVNALSQLMQVRADYLATRIYRPNDHSGFPCFYSAQQEQAIRTSVRNAWPVDPHFRLPNEVHTQL